MTQTPKNDDEGGDVAEVVFTCGHKMPKHQQASKGCNICRIAHAASWAKREKRNIERKDSK